jgi:hypothetical protein
MGSISITVVFSKMRSALVFDNDGIERRLDEPVAIMTNAGRVQPAKARETATSTTISAFRECSRGQ